MTLSDTRSTINAVYVKLFFCGCQLRSYGILYAHTILWKVKCVLWKHPIILPNRRNPSCVVGVERSCGAYAYASHFSSVRNVYYAYNYDDFTVTVKCLQFFSMINKFYYRMWCSLYSLDFFSNYVIISDYHVSCMLLILHGSNYNCADVTLRNYSLT